MAKTVAKKSKTAPKSKQAKAASKAKPVKKITSTKTKPSSQKIKPVSKKSAFKKPVVKKSTPKVKNKKTTVPKTISKKPVIKKQVTKKAIPSKRVVKKIKEQKQINKSDKNLQKKKEVVKKTPQVVINIPVSKKQEKFVKKGELEVKRTVVGKTEEKPEKIEKAVRTSHDEKVSKSIKMDEVGDSAIEKKLKALINLQQIDSKIDRIRIIRGELPLEVQDLEDEVAGMQTRIENYKNELTTLEEAVNERKNAAKQCQTLIKKYESQQSNVRNNREYDSLTKEIEFQNLEIQLCEKKAKEFKANLEAKKEIIEKSEKQLKEKTNDLKVKKDELNDIIAETEKEESILLEKSLENQKIIEDRLLSAYKKIRQNARNGLAVVVVERDACGGCFNKIPPQRQLDISIHKKIIVCEYCGRILVDPQIAGL